MGHEKFGTGHILLGLLATGQGHGFEVLAALEVDPTSLRQAVLTRVTRETS
ncbi:Clp protease N-terminal domain-containing protein [Streptomyces sp. NPDC005878]|uniref:Clp protease N-terminal domain-containing protein n=1 Tax=Streptomyces sp. NPDC005878 TaxID=3157077 RepID=UPI0033D25122